MNAGDAIPVTLLALFALAMIAGVALVLIAYHLLAHRRARRTPTPDLEWESSFQPPRHPFHTRRPAAWLAIRSRNLQAVQSALDLHHAKPCSWMEGLAGEEKLFIAPPVKGWILVLGSGLPDPAEDVDACFRFLLNLSRKLGSVQFFSASRISHHHAWVRLEAGRVLRAYAWAGRTIWKQGLRTQAEHELGLKCLDYSDPTDRAAFTPPDAMAANADKVPLLAARWSLDPAEIDERFLEHERGIAGEPSRRY